MVIIKMKNQIAKAANFNETDPDYVGIDFDLIQAQKHERLRLFKDAQEKAAVEGRIKEIKIKEQNDRI